MRIVQAGMRRSGLHLLQRWLADGTGYTHRNNYYPGKSEPMLDRSVVGVEDAELDLLDKWLSGVERDTVVIGLVRPLRDTLASRIRHWHLLSGDGRHVYTPALAVGAWHEYEQAAVLNRQLGGLPTLWVHFDRFLLSEYRTQLAADILGSGVFTFDLEKAETRMHQPTCNGGGSSYASPEEKTRIVESPGYINLLAQVTGEME